MMSNYFGRNAWLRGPPRPAGQGPGPGGGQGPGGGAGYVEGRGGEISSAVKKAQDQAKALVYQRKKKEENRSNFQENLKRIAVKDEKNYLIFQFREGITQVNFDEIGGILDKLDITASDVVSIAGNPYNSNEFEILLKEEKAIDIATLGRKLDENSAPVTVNKMGKMEEVLIIRNLPLTQKRSLVTNWIKDAVSPFVDKVHDITPLKHTKRQLGHIGDEALKFFEGKFDGNWRVSVTPKGTAEVPSFVAVGPENLQGTVKYSKRVQPVNELCWSCYTPGHKRSDKNDKGDFVCSGPKEWKEYVKEFQENAVNISGKPSEDLFSFSDTGPIIAQLEAELASQLDNIEKANKEKEIREEALKQAQEGLNEALEQNNDKWQAIVKDQEKQKLAQENEFKEKLKEIKKNNEEDVENLRRINEEWQAKSKPVSSGKNDDIEKLRKEVEIMRVELNMSKNNNEALKGEISDLRVENEKLQEQSVYDVLDIADISQKNEDLLNMVIQKSTLIEDEQVESDGIESQDLLEANNDVFLNDKSAAGDGKKHSLSPDSVVSCAPQEKIVRTKSTERSTVKSTSEAENLLTPNPPPPKVPPPFPPTVPRKSPPSILRPLRNGFEVEIYDQEMGNIIGKIVSCQVKKGHADYQKFKDHWNVKIIKGNKIYKDGEKQGFNLSNTKSYRILSMQQPSTSVSKESDLKKS